MLLRRTCAATMLVVDLAKLSSCGVWEIILLNIAIFSDHANSYFYEK